MAASPFAEALEALRRPLAFAEREPEGRGGRLRDLEATLHAAAGRARELAVPREARRVFERLERDFAQPLAPEARGATVRRALELLAPLAAPDFPERALARPLTSLPGVGTKRAALLARRGLASVADLLFLLPTRYDDRRRLSRVGDLEVGLRATFAAQVLVCDFVPFRGRRGGRGRATRAFQAVVGDETGSVNLVWFHGGDALAKVVEKGSWLLVTGDVRRYRFSKEVLHPEVERLSGAPEPGGAGPDLSERPELVPVYPGVEGLPPRALRRLVEAAVAECADLLPDLLPASLARKRRLPRLAEAVRWLHAPPTGAVEEEPEVRSSPARQRLVLEELFVLETGLALRRAARAAEPGVAIPATPALEEAIRALPFSLTPAQRRAWREVRSDLMRPHPMHRLLQGDVGCGKTAVAYLASVAVAVSGHQSALMAPTELLAEQHERTLRRLCEPEGTPPRLRVARLSASLPRAEAEAVRRALAAGQLDLVVGTHALVQEDVRFASLALAIVDEQHRFGVMQRAALAARTRAGVSPHTLVMTATPIPRTLALTVYGDLDLSVIDELPPGRRAVATHVVRPGEGRQVMALLRETLARGEQAYVVYPLVEESEKIDLRAATEQVERIRRALPERRVDLVHGRLDARERAEAMDRFERGETHVLVSTTVIEVGVDVAGVTLMVVEHAERFGLAQLHQLRGRVGRGRRPGTCLLVARGSGEESEARLAAMLETSDGFRIADADLRIRGPGEFLGKRQSGHLPDLRVADLVRDARLVAEARQAALEVVRRDPRLRRQPELLRAVRERWGARLALVDVG